MWKENIAQENSNTNDNVIIEQTEEQNGERNGTPKRKNEKKRKLDLGGESDSEFSGSDSTYERITVHKRGMPRRKKQKKIEAEGEKRGRKKKTEQTSPLPSEVTRVCCEIYPLILEFRRYCHQISRIF